MGPKKGHVRSLITCEELEKNGWLAKDGTTTRRRDRELGGSSSTTNLDHFLWRPDGWREI